MTVTKHATHCFVALTALSINLASGCKSDNDGRTSPGASGGKSSGGEQNGGASNTGATTSGGSAGAGGQPQVEHALYAVATQVFTEDTETTYVVLTETLEGSELSLDDALEVGGRAIVTTPIEGGTLLIGSNESPTVTRYTLDDQDHLVVNKSVSFQGYGVAAIGEYQGQFQFVSKTKAYYFDSRTAQIIIFDPKAMTTKGSVDLAHLTMADQVMTFSPAPLRVDDLLLVPVGFRGTTGTSVPSRTALIAIDTTTDEVTSLTDDRCGYARDIALGKDGFAYLATDAFASAVHRIAETSAPKPCLLRLDVDAKKFDTSFFVELNQLANGETVGSLLATTSGKTFVRVLDESQVTVTASSVPRVLASAKVWSFREISLGIETTLSEVASDVRSGGSMLPFVLGDRTYLPEFSGQVETTLRDVTAGPGAAILTTTGLVFSVAKVR